MDNTEIIEVENPDTFEMHSEEFNMVSDASSTMLKLEFSEIGDPVPFKIIKLEHEDGGRDIMVQMQEPEQTKWITGLVDHQTGPSDIDKLAKDPHSSSSPPPNKRLKTETKLSTVRPIRRYRRNRMRLENNESMEIMSSDDDAFSVDSDMDYDNDSESDSECEYISDDDLLGPEDQDNQKIDGVNVGNNTDKDGWSELQADWTSDETSMKILEFTKKRELLIPPPKTPCETFRWFLNDEILDTIVKETNKYAANVINKKGLAPTSRFKYWKDVTREEMITFVALLIHTGTIRTNRLCDYWKGGYLFNLTCFSKFMTRNRFMLILNCLNFSSLDPDTPETDNKAKIRPVINNFNEKMNEIYYPGKELVIAKSMVFWHGRLVRQEYTDHRRHQNAVNLFMLAEPNGTVVKFQVYTGRSSDHIFRVTTGEIVQELVEDKLGRGHSVYMDRYYSSYKLALKLLECQTYCTGTLNRKTRDNPLRQLPYNVCRLANKSVFSNGVHIGKWRDNKSVTYITTEFKDGLQPVVEKNGSLAQKPTALANFSKYMTCNELQDQLMTYLPCCRNKMRWYKKVFIFSLQIYMNNGFHLYNNHSGNKKKMDYYEYRMSVLKAMLPEPESSRRSALPVSVPLSHTLTKITRTRLREKKEKNGTVRILNEVVRKECRPCRQKKRRTATLYECAACVGSPAYCTTCFCEVHVSTNTPYDFNFDEETTNVSNI